MATAMQRTRPCLSLFFRKLQQRFNSTAINFCNTREESVKHCSGLREKFQFNSEYRGLVIQQSIEHLKTLENFKIKDEVEQIFINDQYQSKGLDEKRYFYCISIVLSVFLWIVIFVYCLLTVCRMNKPFNQIDINAADHFVPLSTTH